ncbi:hypothetical protein [Shewanella psychrophila]|uniref:hypothetical protein n=1 Tax=Shewanella psychrophila TaxID=225848 RepID=UPI0011EA54A8|nr:hypothetical protein [Shewanella psychrophila]
MTRTAVKDIAGNNEVSSNLSLGLKAIYYSMNIFIYPIKLTHVGKNEQGYQDNPPWLNTSPPQQIIDLLRGYDVPVHQM